MNAAMIVKEARHERRIVAGRAGASGGCAPLDRDAAWRTAWSIRRSACCSASSARHRASLEVSAHPLPTLSLARLADARSDTPWGETIDWTRLRATLDELMLHPEAVEAAITTPPARSGSARLDALLAGVAEKLADDAALPRPCVVQGGPHAHRAMAATRHTVDGRAHDRDRARATAPSQHLPR